MQMNAKIEGKKLLIEIPLNKPKTSASGKSLVVATTRGPRRSTVQVDDKFVWVVANAFIYPDESPTDDEFEVLGEQKAQRQKTRGTGDARKP